MTDPDKDRRARWRAYHRACNAIVSAWRASGTNRPMPPFPAWPDGLDDLRCGAKTRAGTPCKRKDLTDLGRCKLHGGMSTGPTSVEGKAWAALNGNDPKRKQSP